MAEHRAGAVLAIAGLLVALGAAFFPYRRDEIEPLHAVSAATAAE